MPSLAIPPSRAPQLDALTGLRFLAAAAVFVSHTKGWFAIENFHPGPIGSAAVGFFFVLSGFILSHVYRGASETTSAGRFYLARFARIWPMHIACLALVCATPQLQAPPYSAEQWVHFANHILLIQSWTLDAVWAQAWNGPAWSLSAEAFFYLLFPLLAQRSNRTLFLTMAALSVALLSAHCIADYAVLADPTSAPRWKAAFSIFPLSRLPEFVAGMCTHAIWQRLTQSTAPSVQKATAIELGGICLIVILLLLWGSGQWGHGWAVGDSRPVSVEALSYGPGFIPGFCLLIAACATGRGLVSRAFATPGIVYLGEISFAFYLVHTIALAIASASARDYPSAWTRPLLAGILMSLGAASLLFGLVETPMRKALLLRAGGLRGRFHAMAKSMGSEIRRKGFSIGAALLVVGIAISVFLPPTLREHASSLVAASDPRLKGHPLALGCTLLGALPEAYPDRFECTAALDGTLPEGSEVRFVATSKDGTPVHNMDFTSKLLTGSRGESMRILLARSALPPLGGASILQLRVCAITDPTHQPLPGTEPVEIFRLPW